MWLEKLLYDPLEPLISSENFAIEHFTRRDLLDEKVSSLTNLWDLDSPQKIIRKQQEDGSWKYPGGHKHVRSSENYNQFETLKQLGELVEKYGFNKNHPSIEKAAKFLFKFQTDEGDIRGIYGNQYTPTYTSAIMELLIKAGYYDDPHIKKGFQWLLKNRQDDGGWAIPLRTMKIKYSDALKLQDTIKSDNNKPFSHLVTGMVLRAFATHPKYRESEEAINAAELLVSRLFLSDKYPDRKDKKYWKRVSYPFLFTDIISALDSLSFLGFNSENHHIQEGLDFLKERQNNKGLFDLHIVRGSDKDLKYWICLAICRLFKRYG